MLRFRQWPWLPQFTKKKFIRSSKWNNLPNLIHNSQKNSQLKNNCFSFTKNGWMMNNNAFYLKMINRWQRKKELLFLILAFWTKRVSKKELMLLRDISAKTPKWSANTSLGPNTQAILKTIFRLNTFPYVRFIRTLLWIDMKNFTHIKNHRYSATLAWYSSVSAGSTWRTATQCQLHFAQWPEILFQMGNHLWILNTFRHVYHVMNK